MYRQNEHQLLESINTKLGEIIRLLKTEAVSGELLTAELAPPVLNITINESPDGEFVAFLATDSGAKAIKSVVKKLQRNRDL